MQSKSSLFLALLGFFVAGWASIVMFIRNDAFDTFTAKIIRLPNAEITQRHYPAKHGVMIKLAIVHDKKHYAEVVCLEEYQYLCAFKHKETKFYADNVALVRTNLARQTSFLIQGNFHLGQDKKLAMKISHERMWKEIKDIRYRQRKESVSLLVITFLTWSLCIILFLAHRYG
ncbi:hypothetical protein [Wielerella bovis]|uniref:hypothetical protein n=1 Tax=Wielerella bovis TaxID=2917790 RepID=UPI0020196D23|nr:hypothetical protein [Wielerella bovis]ULJ60132.1 hypothetical protein MIS44_10830 [Wielerella bovis]